MAALHAIIDENEGTISKCIQKERNLVHEGHRIIDLALEIAVKKGRYSIVCLLLEDGANPNFIEREVVSMPLLNRAALNQDLRTLQALVRYGACPNYRQMDGMNALEEILYQHVVNKDVFYFLVECGCSIEVPLYHYPNLNDERNEEVFKEVKKHQSLLKV
jgi:hypothetical protein